MKRFLALTLTSVMALSSSAVVMADTVEPSATAIELRQATQSSSVSYTQASFPIYVNGTKVTLDQPALKVNVDAGAITFLPLRALAKVLGVADDKVYWDNENKIAAMEKDSTVIEAWDSGNQIVVNKTAKYIYNSDKNVKAFISSDGFTYLPLRAFAENLPNVKIYFEPKTQSIIITTDGSNPETNLPADVQTQINTQPTTPTDPIPPELVDTPQPITPQYNPNAPSVVNGEARPTQPGTYDGELSSGGNWCWDAPMKKWVKWNKDGGNVSLNIDESDLSDSTKEAYQRYIEASKKNN